MLLQLVGSLAQLTFSYQLHSWTLDVTEEIVFIWPVDTLEAEK